MTGYIAYQTSLCLIHCCSTSLQCTFLINFCQGCSLWTFHHAKLCLFCLLSRCNINKHPRESQSLPYKRTVKQITAKNKYSVHFLSYAMGKYIHPLKTLKDPRNFRIAILTALEDLSSRGWVCTASSSHLPSTVCTALPYRKMILLWGNRC